MILFSFYMNNEHKIIIKCFLMYMMLNVDIRNNKRGTRRCQYCSGACGGSTCASAPPSTLRESENFWNSRTRSASPETHLHPDGLLFRQYPVTNGIPAVIPPVRGFQLRPIDPPTSLIPGRMNTNISQEEIHTLYKDLNNLLEGKPISGFHQQL